jgi:hypothetical protein
VAPHGIGAEPHAERLRAVGAARLVTGLAEVLDLLAALPRGPGPSSPCTPLSGA